MQLAAWGSIPQVAGSQDAILKIATQVVILRASAELLRSRRAGRKPRWLSSPRLFGQRRWKGRAMPPVPSMVASNRCLAFIGPVFLLAQPQRLLEPLQRV